jgi:hypothetical protein
VIAPPEILSVAAPVLRAMDTLIEELRGAKADYRAGAKLSASERSLLAVMAFLGTHPVIEDERLLVPLTALLEATNHAAHRGKPPLFQPTVKKSGRPSDPGEDVKRAVIAFCLELLIETKMPINPPIDLQTQCNERRSVHHRPCWADAI